MSEELLLPPVRVYSGHIFPEWASYKHRSSVAAARVAAAGPGSHVSVSMGGYPQRKMRSAANEGDTHTVQHLACGVPRDPWC